MGFSAFLISITDTDVRADRCSCRPWFRIDASVASALVDFPAALRGQIMRAKQQARRLHAARDEWGQAMDLREALLGQCDRLLRISVHRSRAACWPASTQLELTSVQHKRTRGRTHTSTCMVLTHRPFAPPLERRKQGKDANEHH